MKRILIISPMPPLLGGVAVSSGRLYDNLNADGYDVNSYNIRPTGKFFNSSLGKILTFFWIPFYILFHKRYDIIHCHVPGTLRKAYISLAKPIFFKGAKLIFTLHGDVRPLLNRQAISALSKADRLICVQKGDTTKLPESLRTKSVDIPAFIMPKNVSEDAVPSDILDFVKNKKHPLILFYGGIVFNETYDDLYGINDAINMYFSLRSNNIKVQMLMLVTSKSNTDKNFINNIKERLNGDDNVLLSINRNVNMFPLLRYADLYIRPSKTDGDSLAVREALCMGCPVVASDKAVRPAGTAIYSSPEEFETLVEKYITEDINAPEQENFYNQIKEVYGNC